MAIGCGAPLQLGRFGTALRQPSEHRVEPVDAHGASDAIVDLELGLIRSRHEDVTQPHRRLLGRDAGGDVDAAHVEMRKLVGEGARISPCAGLDRPDIGAGIRERTAEHQPQRSHASAEPIGAGLDLRAALDERLHRLGRAVHRRSEVDDADRCMTGIDAGAVLRRHSPLAQQPGERRAGLHSRRADDQCGPLLLGNTAMRCKGLPRRGDNQRGVATAIGGAMALGPLEAGPLESDHPCLGSLQTPDRSVRRGRCKPRGIETEAEVAEYRRRRLDRDQHAARRQQFPQPRQLPPFRQAVQALGSEHEIVARSLRAGIGFQQPEVIVAMGGSLGGLESAAVGLGHRQLDMVAALDLDERGRERTEAHLQDA